MDVLQKYSEYGDDWGSDVELVFQPYVNVFELPTWCRLDEYAYGWLDVKDEKEVHRAFEFGKWRFVKRVNHPKANEADFSLGTGLVERLGLVLIYRPKWLDDEIRRIPEKRHLEKQNVVEQKLVDGVVTDERQRVVARFEPMKASDSDVIMAVEDANTGKMVFSEKSGGKK